MLKIPFLFIIVEIKNRKKYPSTCVQTAGSVTTPRV